jgi:hypothetical protein
VVLEKDGNFRPNNFKKNRFPASQETQSSHYVGWLVMVIRNVFCVYCENHLKNT